MEDRISEAIEIVKNMKNLGSEKNSIIQLLEDVKEENELNKENLEEKHNRILKLNADVKDAQNVATEHMLKNVELEKENKAQGEKLENASKVIENQHNLLSEQGARIGKLQAIVIDIVNKI